MFRTRRETKKLSEPSKMVMTTSSSPSKMDLVTSSIPTEVTTSTRLTTSRVSRTRREAPTMKIEKLATSPTSVDSPASSTYSRKGSSIDLANELKKKYNRVKEKIFNEDVKIPSRFREEHAKLIKEIKNVDPASFMTSDWSFERRNTEIDILEKRNDDLRKSVRLFMAGSEVEKVLEKKEVAENIVLERPKTKLETKQDFGVTPVEGGRIGMEDAIKNGMLSSTEKLIPTIFVR